MGAIMTHWTDTLSSDRAAPRPVGLARRLAKRTIRLGVAAVDRILAWHDRAEGRRRLGAFDDRMLKDIGVSRIEAMNEARKPFWRP